ncbi:hypothetical protein YC2023_011680 [Brassica napus]
MEEALQFKEKCSCWKKTARMIQNNAKHLLQNAERKMLISQLDDNRKSSEVIPGIRRIPHPTLDSSFNSRVDE